MKLFYVCPTESLAHIPTGFHYFELGEGHVVVCIDWQNQSHEAVWAARSDVMCLPHPVFEASKPIHPDHRAHLSRRYTVNDGDGIHPLIQQAAKDDPWMRVWVL